MTWFQFILFLHILTAIAVFGPTFAFPLIGSFAKKDPKNALLATEISEAIERKIVLPGGVVMPFLGLALIYLGHFDLWKSEWLIIGISLYIVAYGFAFFVQDRNVARLVKMLANAPRPPEGAPAGPPPGGPPPELMAQVKKVQMGGMFLTVLLLAIILLMVWRPGSCQFTC